MAITKQHIESALDYVPRWLEYQQRYMPYVGAQVAVRLDHELVFSDAFGYADLATGEKLTPKHLFRIASHSKTFTATAVFQLVEQGSLRLDDTAGALVPELAGSEVAGVSVRELLSHGAGITRDGRDSSFWSLNRLFPDRDELIQTLRDGKILDPNVHFKYSNIGYSLLGLIIEAASGQGYRDYVTANIVDRLGLKDTGPDLVTDRQGDYARGYSSRAHGDQRIEIQHIDTVAESAATGFFSRAEELTDYFQAHLDGDDRLLTDASKRRMRQTQWTIAPDSMYGLGLSITRVNDRTYYGHSGGYPGHITMSKFDPERRLSISVLTNANDGPAATLCNGILQLIDLALDSKHEAKTERQKPGNLEKFTGRFVSLWGIEDVAIFGGRLYSLSPVAENPAAEPCELEVISDHETRDVGDKGYGGYSEVNDYRFAEDGSVTELWSASGERMVPAGAFSLPAVVARPTSRTKLRQA